MPPEPRVLVVDDDPLVRHLARDWLEAAGYHVNTLDHSAGIVAAVEAHRPDLVLLDLMMPDEDVRGGRIMTGGVLALARLAAHHGPPVVLISGAVLETVGAGLVADGGKRLGAVSFLAKPFEQAQLLAVVRRALGAAAGG